MYLKLVLINSILFKYIKFFYFNFSINFIAFFNIKY